MKQVKGTKKLIGSSKLDNDYTVLMEDIVSGLKVLISLDWSEIKTAYEKNDWTTIAFLTIEDAIELIAPFVTQSKVAGSVIHLVQLIVDNTPNNNADNNSSFDWDKFSKAVIILEKTDWSGLYNAMMGNDTFKAANVLSDDLAKVFSPYITIPVPLVSLIATIAAIGSVNK